MNIRTYKEAVSKAASCGGAKYTLLKTQNVLMEQFGKDLSPPATYKGISIFDAYMKEYNNEKDINL